MAQLRQRSNPDRPPTLTSDGKGHYREALLSTWGRVPPYRGVGRPPTQVGPQADWQYLQVIKERSGSRLLGVRTKVIYGDPATVRQEAGEQMAYVERTQLTCRQMNGRLVRKTLSFSKKVAHLVAACAWEDGVYNLVRPQKSLRWEVNEGGRRWEGCSPAMAAGLTDHLWSLHELLTTVVVHVPINTQ